MLQGAITAIVTPFKNGQVDEEAYRELIEFQIQGASMASCPAAPPANPPPCPTPSTNGWWRSAWIR